VQTALFEDSVSISQ